MSEAPTLVAEEPREGIAEEKGRGKEGEQGGVIYVDWDGPQ